MKLKQYVSKKSDGNMSFLYDTERVVLKNRRTFLYQNMIEESSIAYMKVKHTNTVRIDNTNATGSHLCDCLITTSLEKPLFMMTADCIPLTIFSTKTPLVALLHGSWMSLDSGIIDETFKTLRMLNIDFDTLSVHIGPSIFSHTYTHSRIPSQLLKNDWDAFITTSKSLFNVDLRGFVQYELQRFGVSKAAISVTDENTYGSTNYYSYRYAKDNKEKQQRFATLAYLAD